MEQITQSTPVGAEVRQKGKANWFRIERHSVSAKGEEFTHVMVLTGQRRGYVRRVRTDSLYTA